MGARLTLAVATDGARGAACPDADLPQRRAAETRRALAALVEPHLMGFADGALRSGAELEGALRALIAQAQPDLILTHAPNDYHADHRALSQAVSQAAGFAAPVLFMDTMNGTGFVPTHWVEVTPWWDAKIAAIRAHDSQSPERFVAMATRQAAFRAGECNGPLESRAEAFQFAPRFPFADIRRLLPSAPVLRPVGRESAAAKPSEGHQR